MSISTTDNRVNTLTALFDGNYHQVITDVFSLDKTRKDYTFKEYYLKTTDLNKLKKYEAASYILTEVLHDALSELAEINGVDFNYQKYEIVVSSCGGHGETLYVLNNKYAFPDKELGSYSYWCPCNIGLKIKQMNSTNPVEIVQALINDYFSRL